MNGQRHVRHTSTPNHWYQGGFRTLEADKRTNMANRCLTLATNRTIKSKSFWSLDPLPSCRRFGPWPLFKHLPAKLVLLLKLRMHVGGPHIFYPLPFLTHLVFDTPINICSPSHQLTGKCTDPCRKTTFLLEVCTSMLVGGRVKPFVVPSG